MKIDVLRPGPEVKGGPMKPILILSMLLLLAVISKTGAEPTIHFGYPFKDSLEIRNESADTIGVKNIILERISGNETALFFEFKESQSYFLTGFEQNDLETWKWDGTYKMATDLRIPPKASVKLSGFNMGHLPLRCDCEDALASYPNPHVFKVTFEDDIGKNSYLFEGNVYSRPPDAGIKSRKAGAKGRSGIGALLGSDILANGRAIR